MCRYGEVRRQEGVVALCRCLMFRPPPGASKRVPPVRGAAPSRLKKKNGGASRAPAGGTCAFASSLGRCRVFFSVAARCRPATTSPPPQRRSRSPPRPSRQRTIRQTQKKERRQRDKHRSRSSTHVERTGERVGKMVGGARRSSAGSNHQNSTGALCRATPCQQQVQKAAGEKSCAVATETLSSRPSTRTGSRDYRYA